MDKEFWKGKKVFVTGHTGFKGSWLSMWLNELGANVTGYSLKPKTNPSLFESCQIDKKLDSCIGDVRNYENLKDKIISIQPDIVFHMAAQALVLDSYQSPVETYHTNLMGTVNILNAIRDVPSIKAFINITSDKCYQNNINLKAFRETDPLGGSDPYSSSKACSELITAAYRTSFFKDNIGIATARAGNVIGGGDWALNRIIPDFIKKIEKDQTLLIRNPDATRPWQFVLEPLNGYLILAEKLFLNSKEYSESWNFGPDNNQNKSVKWLVSKFDKEYGKTNNFEIKVNENQNQEAKYLELDCSKSIKRLNWKPKLNIEKCISMTCAWYKNFYSNDKDMYEFSVEQIKQFELV
ncbi:MAG: CDP-glucose 4,6-dehydratase [Nitrosomonadales bacterium]|nr:CDP-glucose 4,6-dehydratase [Nitrosomonadales bacterium]|tara:strand:+ start:187 stop:1242 length:1056 start_codon:yes stop_codon:yes gene_type:complete